MASESEFLTNYNPSDYPAIAVTSDVVLLTIRQGKLAVLLVRRADHPFKGHWALPGGFAIENEDLTSTARRELAEETGIETFDYHLEQLKTYSSPNRDPRMRVISTAYLAFMPEVPTPKAGSDAELARFWLVEDLFKEDSPQIAFDHEEIITDAIERARAKLEYTSLATSFLEEPFTLPDLRRVYEAVWNVTLHQSNFNRKVLSSPGFVVETGQEVSVNRGRPVMLYKKGSLTQLAPPILRS